MVPDLASVRRDDLGAPIASLARLRDEMLAAVDYLFFGVWTHERRKARRQARASAGVPSARPIVRQAARGGTVRSARGARPLLHEVRGDRLVGRQ